MTKRIRTIVRYIRRQDLTEDQQAGWFLVSAIVMTLLLTAVGLSVASLVALQYQHTTRETFVDNAQQVAEAGIEQSVYELNTNSAFTGYTTAQQFFNDSTQGKGTFTTTIATNSDGKSKTITSTGKVYRSSTATTPYISREVRVIVVGTSSSGYSVESGPGGLILGGSANITNSDVYVGGTITMSGASQIGTSSNPVNVDVGNDACPTGSSPGPTYPTVCTSGQPISLAFSTNIYGTVCATGQTSLGPNNNIKGGNGGSGLQSGCTAPVATPPTYDRMSQVNAVTTTAAGTSNTYVCNSFPFNRNWPANLKLTGNVEIGGSCNVTLNGNAYITGNLSIDGASTTTVANALGSNRPVVIVDGTITVGGSAAIAANATGTGVEFISFKSANACTISTTAYCPTITGNDLKSSQTTQTVSIGGAANLPGMIFDAYWGEITLGGSGKVGAAAGQTVNMSGAGTVIFGTSLSSGSETWSITSYQPLFSP
jgi:Tfp pilus assembly protein PilX